MIAKELSELQDNVFDVVVVGGGAAALTAATTAARAGASVAVLEAAPQPGGTTAKSSGGFWIPHNRIMRERAESDERFVDRRDACLAHMSRLSYPDLYDADAERHGLPQDKWDLIVNHYDHAYEAIEDLESTGDLSYMLMGSFRGDDLGLPTWYETPEDGLTYGRLLAVKPFDEESAAKSDPFAVLTSREGIAKKRGGRTDAAMHGLGGAFGDGTDLVRTLIRAAKKYGATIVVEHRVRDLLTDDAGAVTGVIADTPSGEVTVHARRGVVFGTGGMEHNRELRERYLRQPIVGSCGVSTNRGDFIEIAERHGAALANTREAWWMQLPLEPCLESFEQGEVINQNHGDSAIAVNASGKRVVSEKMSYNERCKVHSIKDEDGNLPNRFLFHVFDDAVLQDDTAWPARWPVPMPDEPLPRYVLKGDTFEELAGEIAKRLAELEEHTDGFALQPDFAENLSATVERFNGFARSGVDEDFGRGSTWPEIYWSVEFRDDPMPNPSMYPFAEEGPYYAIIIGASCLGTKGGPKINTRSQVVRPDGTPIPGLYGAGNCIGSPTGEAYWGGGSTLGPGIFNGWLAGKNVVLEPVTEPGPVAAGGE